MIGNNFTIWPSQLVQSLYILPNCCHIFSNPPFKFIYILIKFFFWSFRKHCILSVSFGLLEPSYKWSYSLFSMGWTPLSLLFPFKRGMDRWGIHLGCPLSRKSPWGVPIALKVLLENFFWPLQSTQKFQWWPVQNSIFLFFS